MATTAPRAAVVPDAGYVILIAAAAAMGGFLFGFDTAIINGTVLALSASSTPPASASASPSRSRSGLGHRCVRRRTPCRSYRPLPVMMLASVTFSVSAIGSGIPFGLVDFIAWRVLGGVAVGAASVIAPAYIAEVSPAHMRGRLGSLQQLAIVVGIFVALLSTTPSPRSPARRAPFWLGLEAWRWMFWSGAAGGGHLRRRRLRHPRVAALPRRPGSARGRARGAARIVGDRGSTEVARSAGPSRSERKPISRPARRPLRPAPDRLGRHGSRRSSSSSAST